MTFLIGICCVWFRYTPISDPHAKGYFELLIKVGQLHSHSKNQLFLTSLSEGHLWLINQQKRRLQYRCVDPLESYISLLAHFELAHCIGHPTSFNNFLLVVNYTNYGKYCGKQYWAAFYTKNLGIILLLHTVCQLTILTSEVHVLGYNISIGLKIVCISKTSNLGEGDGYITGHGWYN